MWSIPASVGRMDNGALPWVRSGSAVFMMESPPSLGCDAEPAGHVLPPAVLGLNEMPELFGRIALGQDIAFFQGRAHRRRRERCHGSLLDFVQDGPRRAGRRQQAIQRAAKQLRIACLGGGGN